MHEPRPSPAPQPAFREPAPAPASRGPAPAPATTERLPRSVLTPDAAITVDPGYAVLSAGLDLVDVDRLQLAFERCGPALLRRLFDPGEQQACAGGRDRQAAADLFGIKESVVKTVGGFSPGDRYADISVGAPAVDLDGVARRPVRLRGELARWADARQVALVAGAAPLADGVRLTWTVAVRQEPSC